MSNPSTHRLSPIRSLLLATLSLPTIALANDNPGAHQHGHGQIQVAIEGQSLDILFRSPAASLNGFEHAPRTADQEARVKQTQQWLQNTPLLSVGEAPCELITASVELKGMKKTDEHHDDEHGHHHEHDHHHKVEHEEASHSEYEVSQQVACPDGNAIESLTSPMMGHFDHLEILQVEWVSPQGQGSGRLAAPGDHVELN